MYHFPVCSSSSLHDSLAHSRVRMYGLNDLMAGCFKFTGNNNLSYHFSYIGTYHVATQPLAVFSIKYHLHKTFFRSGRTCLTRSRERELTNFKRITFRFRLLLG